MLDTQPLLKIQAALKLKTLKLDVLPTMTKKIMKKQRPGLIRTPFLSWHTLTQTLAKHMLFVHSEIPGGGSQHHCKFQWFMLEGEFLEPLPRFMRGSISIDKTPKASGSLIKGILSHFGRDQLTKSISHSVTVGQTARLRQLIDHQHCQHHQDGRCHRCHHQRLHHCHHQRLHHCHHSRDHPDLVLEEWEEVQVHHLD